MLGNKKLIFQKITKKAGNEYEEVMEEIISNYNSSDDGGNIASGDGEGINSQ